MTLYEYRCEQDGLFEILRPIGTAPPTIACARCGSQAKRVFSVPTLRSSRQRALIAAIDHAEKSGYEPEVVQSPPPVDGPRRTLELTPVLQGLPRP